MATHGVRLSHPAGSLARQALQAKHHFQAQMRFPPEPQMLGFVKRIGARKRRLSRNGLPRFQLG